MKSIWSNCDNRKPYKPLNRDTSTDVLIIGGGMAGLLCCHMLTNAGVDCVLVEAKRICDGTTKNTTAKITMQHGAMYDKLITRFGYEKAKAYVKAQERACREFEQLCRKIDCEYEKKDSYVYSLNDRIKMEKETAALRSVGVNAELCDLVGLPFQVAGAVRVKDQAQFHPLKFALRLAEGLPIYENTKVVELAEGRAVTLNGVIRCKKMIIATHFPILNKHGGFYLKMYQHRSYVLALQNAQSVDGMYVDEDEKGMSFRNMGNLLLLGGGGHRTGKKGGNWHELEAFANEFYPMSYEVDRWAAQDCMTLDSVPYIGQYAKSTPNLYVATGFNKWGMTSSMVSAMLLSSIITGKKSKYSDVFLPQRSILRPQLAVNAFESILGLITPTTPRCPHLGCALKYNRDEHSWDCPCHGSRFTESGELIDNPATDDRD